MSKKDSAKKGFEWQKKIMALRSVNSFLENKNIERTTTYIIE